jgi:heterodisulfide reductase subunit B
MLSAARNLALAGQRGLDILTPCKCCYGSLRHADHWLRKNPALRQEINDALRAEGLEWGEGIRIRHLLSVLAQEVGLEAIGERVKKRYKGLKIAAHYGCHALRPSQVVDFDDPLAPTLFESLVEVTGAESVDWQRRLECCGNPLWGKNDALSLDLMGKKMADAGKAGADYLCTACTYCQMQFDTVQDEAWSQERKAEGVAAILYPQLLGLSMGFSEEALGLDHNKIDIGAIKDFLS